MKKIIVTIADTHDQVIKYPIPAGDILVCAGDITGRGDASDIVRFNNLVGELPHEHKILISGNHDFCFENNRENSEKMVSNFTYLQDSKVEIDGIKFYGSPWQPWFYDWAFNLQRGKELADKWAMIPDDTDILITHGPPMGFGDYTLMDRKNVGCEELLAKIEEIKPKVHVFGHIHEGYGTYENDSTLFVNASICTLRYDAINKPIVFVYDTEDGSVKLQDKFDG
jgi:Icc-related predicted phosphoesterase